MIELLDQFVGTRYEERMNELLNDPECTIVTSDTGILVYAPVAGARDVTKVHLLLGDESLIAKLPRSRLLIAELPDDPLFAEMRRMLLARGFEEESSAADLVAEGVSMAFLVRRS